MRHRCWGSGFPEDRLGSFREARVALSAGVACWRGLGTVYCTKVGIYWGRVGCTGWGSGVRAVWITLDQWIPTLVEWRAATG